MVVRIKQVSIKQRAKPTVLGVASVLAVVCERMQQLPTMLDLQCIVGRIPPIRLCKPCVMHLCGPSNVGRVLHTDATVVAPRFGGHGTKNKMLRVAGSKVWPVSNFRQRAQQDATTCNKGGVVGQLQAKFRTRAKISSELRHGPPFVQFIAPKGKEVWSNFWKFIHSQICLYWCGWRM